MENKKIINRPSINDVIEYKAALNYLASEIKKEVKLLEAELNGAEYHYARIKELVETLKTE